jgi:hypothetical protein
VLAGVDAVGAGVDLKERAAVEAVVQVDAQALEQEILLVARASPMGWA